MKKYEIDMTHGSITKKLLLFSLPLMLSSVLQLLYNAADIVVVGRFDGETSLAAVGSTSSLITLIVNLFIGYSTGAGVVISKCFGAQDKAGTERAVRTCITMSFIFGIFLMFVGVIGARFFLELMSSPEDVIDKATLYMRIYFLGMPAFMLYNFGSGVLRAVGDTKRPLYYASLSGVVNVFLNLVFVIKFKMGVAGVALATIIAQYISAFLIIRCLIKSRESYRFNLKNIGIDKKEFMQMTKIGLPAGIQGSMFSISNVTIQSVVNSYGSIVMAGNAAANNIDGFVYAVLNSISQGVLTFSGQNFGAGKMRRIRKGVAKSLLLSFVVVGSISLFVNVFSHQLLGIYSADKEVVEIGAYKMLFVAGTYFICGFNEIFVSGIRGVGHSFSPMLTSIFGICGIRIIYIMTIYKLFNSLPSLYLAYPISWTITTIINGILFYIIWKKTADKMKSMT